MASACCPYVPEICRETGELLARMVDEGDKLKNLSQGWHGQTDGAQLTQSEILEMSQSLLF
jgi:hypothetical protein